MDPKWDYRLPRNPNTISFSIWSFGWSRGAVIHFTCSPSCFSFWIHGCSFFDRLSLPVHPSLPFCSDFRSQRPALFFFLNSVCVCVTIHVYVRISTCQHMQPARNWNFVFSIQYFHCCAQGQLIFTLQMTRLPVNLKYSCKTDFWGLE